MKPLEHLLDYVRFDTQSDHDSKTYPSTAKQLILLDHLFAQLKALGLNATRDEYGYVIAILPANTTRRLRGSRSSRMWIPPPTPAARTSNRV
ncbi:MAG: hypothetical protein MZU97_16685 [Bacillus subtilis]|nr:hypothetical protein [Bacillus subtilis]